MQKKVNIELKNKLRTLIHAETRLLDLLIHRLVEKEYLDQEQEIISETIKIMLQSIGISMHSVLKLTEEVDMAIKDCFGIARTISEMSINVAYIASSDVGVANRAQTHAFQRTYRDLKRSTKNNVVSIKVEASGIPDPGDINGLQAALNMFTTKKGKEIKAWSPKSLDEKIEHIGQFDKNAAQSLTVSKFTIYQYSSQLLHGSYYGVKYFWTSPNGKKLDDLGFEENWLNSHFMTVFTAVFFGASGVIETCINKFGIVDLKEVLTELFDRASEIILPLEQDDST